MMGLGVGEGDGRQIHGYIGQQDGKSAVWKWTKENK